jgi:16S rRNA processing protein RimM
MAGEVAGAFGVLGWIKVKSFTDPPLNIVKYVPWTLEFADRVIEVNVVEGRSQGHFVVARVEGVNDRDKASALKGGRISVPRSCFPRAPAGSYYWVDLLGLDVLTESGFSLGKVVGLMETGANDVLQVKGERERLIPFVIGQFVKNVDIDKGFIVVDWDPEF